jgi:hypothetical protein
MTILVRSHQNYMNDDRDVAIFVRNPDGSRLLAAPLVFAPLDERVMTPPTISAAGGSVSGKQFLQAALDHAWEAGLRPAGFNDTTNQVAAIKDHLADMRALVFKDSIKPNGAA